MSELEIIKKNINSAGHAVLNVGNPGNRGNPNAPGRPKSAVRAMCLEGFAERIARLNAVMDSILNDPAKLESAAARADLIKIMDLNGRYSGLASVEVDHSASIQVTVVYDDLDPQLPEDLRLEQEECVANGFGAANR